MRAQGNPSGTIVGTIKDVSGAVPGVTVLARNSQTELDPVDQVSGNEGE